MALDRVETTSIFPSGKNDTVVDTNSTGDTGAWGPEDVTFLVLYCCSSVVGTMANVFVMVAAAGTSSRSRNLLILSLCASDLLVSTISMPLSASAKLLKIWTMGLVFCKTSFYFQSFPVAASTTSLMMLAMDRYAIVKHSKLLSKLRPQQMVAFVWSVAAFVTSPIFYAREINRQQCRETWPTDQLRTAFTLSHIAIVYVIPCLTVASCHFSVGHKLCAASSSSLPPLPIPLIRKPQHVIIVASVLPDSPSKLVPFKGNDDDDECLPNENLRNDVRVSPAKPKLLAGRQNKMKSSQRNAKPNRRPRKVPPLVKQVSRQSLHSRRRLANMLVAMVIVFAVCWAPYVCFKISSEAGVHLSATILPFCLLLGHTHSAINPLVYYFSNRQSLGNKMSWKFQWPWDKHASASVFRRPAPSSTNEAALGPFHPSYTMRRYQPNKGCTNDYL